MRTQIPPNSQVAVLTRDKAAEWLNVVHIGSTGDTLVGWVKSEKIDSLYLADSPIRMLDLKITDYKDLARTEILKLIKVIDKESREVARRKSSMGKDTAIAVGLLSFSFLFSVPVLLLVAEGQLTSIFAMLLAFFLSLCLALPGIALFMRDMRRVGSINDPLNERLYQLSQQRRYFEQLQQQKEREERGVVGNWLKDTKEAAQSAAKKATALAAAGGTALAAIAALKAANAASEREKQRKHQLNIEKARGQKDIRIRHD